MTKQPEYNSLTDECLHRQRDEATYKKWIQRDFSSDKNYDEFANETLFVGGILKPFQLEPVFTVAEIQSKKDLAGTN